ncbi:MAG: TetR/AcrR family transcriptional regulator [Hyphomicrobiaceae bacterium]
MPRLKPAVQKLRREHILDAAERCFGEAGFHRTTMQGICKAAGVSPGAVYVYFDSKEALIEGIVERDRAQFQARFQQVVAAEDVMAALNALGNQYLVDEPAYKNCLCIEMGIEATRNERVGTIVRAVDELVLDSFRALFQRLKDQDRIRPVLDVADLAKVFMVLGDGVFWRRAVDPGFDAKATLPAVMHVIENLLRPVEGPGAAARCAARKGLEMSE